MTTYVVTPYDGEPYEVEAASIEIDEANSNRVTFLDADGKRIAQENNASSARPGALPSEPPPTSEVAGDEPQA